MEQTCSSSPTETAAVPVYTLNSGALFPKQLSSIYTEETRKWLINGILNIYSLFVLLLRDVVGTAVVEKLPVSLPDQDFPYFCAQDAVEGVDARQQCCAGVLNHPALALHRGKLCLCQSSFGDLQ